MLPTKRLDKFEMKFTTPEILQDYILLHIQGDLIISVQNGYIVADINNDGVFSLVSLKLTDWVIKTLIESLESLFPGNNYRQY